MDKAKVLLLLIILAVLVSSASALLYRVDVDDSLNHSSFDLQYRNQTDTLQVVSSTVTNTGSVGCEYRLKAEIYTNGEQATHYSKGYELWPGRTERMQLKFISGNASGMIETDLYLEYCGKQESLETFSFNDTGAEVTNNSIDSTTIEASEKGAEARLPVKEAILVPIETPPYWKVSSTEVNQSRAEFSYNAPIFNEREQVRFAVMNRSTEEIIGETTVQLEAEESVLQTISQNIESLALAASLLLNLALAAVILRRHRK